MNCVDFVSTNVCPGVYLSHTYISTTRFVARVVETFSGYLHTYESVQVFTPVPVWYNVYPVSTQVSTQVSTPVSTTQIEVLEEDTDVAEELPAVAEELPAVVVEPVAELPVVAELGCNWLREGTRCGRETNGTKRCDECIVLQKEHQRQEHQRQKAQNLRPRCASVGRLPNGEACQLLRSANGIACKQCTAHATQPGA
jgi:hypothetical protein